MLETGEQRIDQGLTICGAIRCRITDSCKGRLDLDGIDGSARPRARVVREVLLAIRKEISKFESWDCVGMAVQCDFRIMGAAPFLPADRWCTIHPHVMEQVEPNLKVTDRRQFTADGELKEDALRSSPEDQANAAPPGRAASPAPPPVTFSAFVVSLATQAADFIGGAHKDLGAAQQVISALEMLQDKTLGRRTEDESRLVEVVLFDLRMAFVGSAKASQPEAALPKAAQQ